MTLDELEAEYRRRSGDLAKPPLASPEVVRGWLNEAQTEGCIRADLLREADDPRICQFQIAANDASAIELDDSVIRVTYASFVTDADSCDHPLEIVVDRLHLDRVLPGWRRRTEQPKFLLVENNQMRVGCIPECAGTLYIEVFRTPLKPMKDGKDTPEIAAQHHLELVHWPLFRAYSEPDLELRDPGKAKDAKDAFTRYFGERPDADARQAQEAKPQFNVPILP